MILTQMCMPDTFRDSLQAAALIRPSVEPSVFVKSLRNLLFSTCTALQMTSQVFHVIVSEWAIIIVCGVIGGLLVHFLVLLSEPLSDSLFDSLHTPQLSSSSPM